MICSGGKMKKIGFGVFIVALIIGVGIASIVSWGKSSAKLFNLNFSLGSVHGSGNLATETRDIEDFRAIDVSGVFVVELVAQKDFSVQVEADDNVLQYIKTEVDDGVLEISTTRKIKSSSGLKVRISAPDIEKIEASGATKVSVADLKNTGLEVDTSGASKVSLKGESEKFVVDVSGASNIDAGELKAKAATVSASGASQVNLYVTDSLRSKASGASKIVYSGGASDVVTKTSGAGSISPK